MTIWVCSQGLYARRTVLNALFNHPIEQLNSASTPAVTDIFAGWGQKANTKQIKQQAQEYGVPYWQLEDGFIGYIGHPARGGKAVSLVADPIGIYYDARTPSHLEQLIAAPCDPALLDRAALLIAEVVRLGVTKYNCYDTLPVVSSPRFSSQGCNAQGLPLRLAQQLSTDDRAKVLLVDQVAGDLSIPGALACDDDFLAMVEAARRNHPHARLLLRTHPDTRFGKKRGVLARLQLNDVEVIADHCHPHVLLKQVEAVYTVSSQLGFEALLLGKPVYCFGMPFYAGWGLTHDSKQCVRRCISVSLVQLVAAALILYPRYLDPVLGQRCEVEDILQIIACQQKPRPRWRRLYLVGFSLWKRSFMQAFCRHLADELRFVRSPPERISDDEQILVWGSRYPELTSVIRVEDGFIRSKGLGSNLCRPSSLSIDSVGIYFDSRNPSGLEQVLNYHSLTEAEAQRGADLLELLRQHRVSKYNVGEEQHYQPPGDGRRLVLVVGQVDGDASIVTGSSTIRSNEQLLWAVRAANPQAHILYKPHPDVVAGNRLGAISASCLAACVDSQVLDIGLSSLYPHVDELHTMTSLSGFEALVQGVKVTTWGQPFYSGWGLTTDVYPPARRYRNIPLSWLVYLTLAVYPHYIDWNTGFWITPEQLIQQLAMQGKAVGTGLGRWRRWYLKVNYLLEAVMPLVGRK